MESNDVELAGDKTKKQVLEFILNIHIIKTLIIYKSIDNQMEAFVRD